MIFLTSLLVPLSVWQYCYIHGMGRQQKLPKLHSPNYNVKTERFKQTIHSQIAFVSYPKDQSSYKDAWKPGNTLESRETERGEEWPWERDYNLVRVIDKRKRLMLDQLRLKKFHGFNFTI